MSESLLGNQASHVMKETLGKYRLEQALERRGPVLLFLARERQTQQSCRVWVLALPSLTPEDHVIYLGHFQQEAGRLLTLRHPNLLSFCDYGISQGIPYLAAPYSPARTLSVLLREKGPVDLRQAGRYLDQLAGALEYAHQQGIWHLNLTTDCVLVQESGNLVITELGIARILGSGAKLAAAYPPESQSKVMLPLRDAKGRPLYGLSAASAPAPELLLGASVNASTDVYGLGAVLYRMLTGHRVFASSTPEELVRKHFKAPIPSLSRWRSGISADIDKLLAMALAKDPARRFQRPGAFANAYRQFIEAERTGHQASAPQAAVSGGQLSTSAEMPILGEQWNSSATRTSASGGIPVLGLVAEQRQSPATHTSTSGEMPVPGLVAEQRQSPAACTSTSAKVPVSGHLSGWLHLPSMSTSAKTSEPSSFARRRFVALLAVSCGAVAVVTSVTLFSKGSSSNSGSTGPDPVKPSATGTVLARPADVPLNSAKKFALTGSNNPGLLIHLPDDRFVAFDSTCTHAGCAVAYNASDKLLECPCHGAVFDPAKNAAVVQGPALLPLKAIPITVQADGTITTVDH